MSSEGDTLFAWQVLDHRDGEWGLVSAMIPALGISSPLVARSMEHIRCDDYLAVVAAHRQMQGDPIRLARFTLVAVEEEIE